MTAPELSVGVDIGGTKILGVVIDRAEPRTVRAEHRVPTPDGAANVLDAIAGVVRTLDAGEAAGSVTSVGVGIAGLVTREGVLRVAPNLAELRDVAVKSELEQRVALPVTVDNDATCAAWGEHQAGAALGYPDALFVALGTGIGAGIVAGGDIERGVHGFAGEAGHMVVDPSGPFCPCGRRGCWERFASGSGLGRLARDAADAGRLRAALRLAGGDVQAVRGEHVAKAAQEGDEQALDLLRSFAWWVALGVANLVTFLDPGVVVIGGGLIEIGGPLMDPVREHYGDLVMAHDHRADVEIRAAELGERAGAIGAAMLD
ncbi:MAG TPA: ROK family protein [Acidimicrobiales bacterium]|nr:ROK family protein [Acidimicrobiales bacterium]